MLAVQNNQIPEQRRFLRAAMAIEEAYPEVVAEVRAASAGQRRAS